MSNTSHFLTGSESLPRAPTAPGNPPLIPRLHAVATPVFTNSRRELRIFSLPPGISVHPAPWRYFPLLFDSYRNLFKSIFESHSSFDFMCSSQVTSLPVYAAVL